MLTAEGDSAFTANVSREGDLIHVQVQVQGAQKAWRVLLRSVGSTQSVEGGSAQADALGTLLVPQQGANRLAIRL